MMESCNRLILTVSIIAMSSVTVCMTSSSDKQEDWIDPFDMVNFDQAAGKMVNKHDRKSVKGNELPPIKISGGMGNTNMEKDRVIHEEVKRRLDHSVEDEQGKATQIKKPPQQPTHNSQVHRTLYRKHVKMLLDKWDSQAGSGDEAVRMTVSLSSHDINLLRSFADRGQGQVYDVDEVLQKMIVKVDAPHSSLAQGSSLESYVGNLLAIFIQILSVLALLYVILWIEITLQVAWPQKIMKFIGLSFLVSIPWTWYHMYKQEEAKRQSELMKDMPETCVKRKLSFFDMAVELVRSTFTLSEDHCVKYYEHILVDPVWKVAPTEAIAVTFVRFFLSPAKYVGHAVSEFVKGTFQDLPVTLWPIVLGCGMLILILILLFSFGYSIRLPFLLSIEPNQSAGYKHKLEALTAENTLQKKMIEELRDKLSNSEREKLSIMSSVSLRGTKSCVSMESQVLSDGHQMHFSSSDSNVKAHHATPQLKVESLDYNDRSPVVTAEPMTLLPVQDAPKVSKSCEAPEVCNSKQTFDFNAERSLPSASLDSHHPFKVDYSTGDHQSVECIQQPSLVQDLPVKGIVTDQTNGLTDGKEKSTGDS